MYTKVSILKNGDGAGCAVIKDPNIILIDVDDIVTEPTRSHGNVVMKGDYTLAENAKSIAVYATPTSIACGADQEGEVDAKGYKDKVECIIVHCEVGVSRSAGVMAAIQKYLTGDDSAIFNNGAFSPNMYCYRMMLDAFEI